jgi:membrane fusion protein, copper/silver efflux system
MKFIKGTVFRTTLVVVIILTLGMVVAGGIYLKPEASKEKSVSGKKQYVCSMHPEVVQDKPGDCPICAMALIEKIDHDTNLADSTLNDVVSPVNQSVLGSIATVMPVQTDLPVTIKAYGIINWDPGRISTVSARFRGVIERSFVKYQFQPVRKGQKIFEIYCPDIYLERWNYIKLIQMYPDQDNLTVEAREWLSLLGLTPGQIDSLKHSPKPNYHLPVYSDADGFAVSSDFDPAKFLPDGENSADNPEGLTGKNNIGLNDGTSVETGDPLFRLIDKNSLRADIKVNTEDACLLKKGQKVSLTDAVSHDKNIEATISLIEPLNGGLFQLVKVYTGDNEGIFLPGKLIQASISAGTHTGLWIPRTAVYNLGQHQAVFILKDNRFIAAPVTTGLRSGEMVEILEGVEKGVEIALKATLLTDSDGFINTGSR